ncbi:sensor histidine kinase [Clostridium sp. LBM24168]
MKISLRKELTVSYILVTIVCVFLISILMNILLEKQFREYTVHNQEHSNQEVADLISRQYDNGKWNSTGIENIGVNYIERGMFIKVSNSYNKTIWDASTHNNGLCKKMLDDMEKNMNKYYPGWNGKYKDKQYPLYHDNEKIGIMTIGYYGPFYYNNIDLTFIYNLKNRILIFAFVFSLILAEILGTIMAQMLSKPIAKIVRATESISKGHFDNFVDENSSTEEIYILNSAVNNMAKTLKSHGELKKRMSDDIAHELRTPLTTLQSHIEAMIDGVWKPDIERLQSCYEEVIRIAGLVGDLEMLGKYENKDSKLSRTIYDIYDQIKNIVFNFQAEFKNRGVEIKLNGNSQEIFAEKDKIGQAIVNLISNALKYTPRNGMVLLDLKGMKNEIKLSIKDTGIGISGDDLPFIFDRFYRADKSRNRATGGRGIGLAISKTIIESHGGRIEVRSALNEGSEFTIFLPRNIG